MYGKIKDARPDDSKIEEIIAWVNEAAKDSNYYGSSFNKHEKRDI